MKVEHPTRLRRPLDGTSATLVADNGATPFLSALAAEVVAMLPRERDVAVARCPFALDVFGGAADFAGALVLLLPLADHACVAAECRDDGTVRVAWTASGPTRRVEAAADVTALLAGASEIKPSIGQARSQACDEPALLAMLGAVAEGVRTGALQVPAGGLTLAGTASSLTGPVAGRLPALAGATLQAVSRLQGSSPADEVMLEAGQRVLAEWLGFSIGSSLAAGFLCAHSRVLVRVRGVPYTAVDTAVLPEGLTIIAVDCGAFDADWHARCLQVRSATAMGRTLIDRIIAHEQFANLNGEGSLSRVGVEDYVKRFRDRLPTKLRGGDYLGRFGPPDDPLAIIEPAGTYKVRSRTEHHIYEHARAVQFTGCLERFAEVGRGAWVKEVAELFAASHWSYGQRCGLGSMESDALVRGLCRSHLAPSVFGAKVCGQGCGGMVCALVRDDDEARDEVRAAVRSYESQTGREARWISIASSDEPITGAMLLSH